MYQRFYHLILLFIFVTSGVNAANTDDTERKAATVIPEETGEQIVYQWQGGNWRYEGVRGNYRLVITESPSEQAALSSNKLYIQWWVTADGKQELAYSVSVRELNQSPMFKFAEVQCGNDYCSRLRVDANHVYEEYEQVFSFELEQLGKYRIEL